jgi:hypothetical protein
LHPYGRVYMWKQPEVIDSHVRGIVWLFHFSNQFLGQKLLQSSALCAGALPWWRIQWCQSLGIFLYTASFNCLIISM